MTKNIRTFHENIVHHLVSGKSFYRYVISLSLVITISVSYATSLNDLAIYVNLALGVLVWPVVSYISLLKYMDWVNTVDDRESDKNYIWNDM